VRIIGGKWAGRSLVSPSGRVRPTSEQVRAALMDLVKRDLKDARCLDLFAGTGAIGLEALSRGARYCDFVESGPAAIHSLKANVAAMRTRNKTRIFDRDAIPFVERITRTAYDIAFADPPYESRKLDRIVKRWLEQPFSRILVLEHAPEHVLPRGGKTKRVGDSQITIFVQKGQR
jgi:16S rRNA (guanine966-N2)-methyltransferase